MLKALNELTAIDWLIALIVCLLLSIGLPGCAMNPNAAMTPEQIAASNKAKDANVTCVIANTPWGRATTVYLNVDRGVIQAGSLTVDEQCKATFQNASPPAPATGTVTPR